MVTRNVRISPVLMVKRKVQRKSFSTEEFFFFKGECKHAIKVMQEHILLSVMD